MTWKEKTKKEEPPGEGLRNCLKQTCGAGEEGMRGPAINHGGMKRETSYGKNLRL